MAAVKNQLTPSVESMLADAVHAELFASHLYKHVANQLQRLGYFGAQKFFARESADELTHYQRHVDYINDRGGVAAVPALPDVPEPINTLQDALQLAYDTELSLQSNYVTWYTDSDVITQQHLLQFIEIQRKAVGEYGDLLARAYLVGDDLCGILLIDQEMAGN
jgi:ferritin